MSDKKILTVEQLRERAIRFFDRYEKDLEQIRQLLNIRLTQLALAYTITNNLPNESVNVVTRVKPQKSFLKKLEAKGWPQFYYPTEVLQDLIGARVICWFIDDCEGIQKLILSSKHLRVKGPIDNYIINPKPSGYRSIHLLANISYDSVQRSDDNIVIFKEEMVCEIQIRTKLQDAWGDVTHEFHYKAKSSGIDNKTYEENVAQIANRLANEDQLLMNLRNAYQALADEKFLGKSNDATHDDEY